MKKTINKTIKKLYWLTPLIVGLIPFLSRIIYYPVGDDYIMNFIVRGSLSNKPDEYIPFVNIVIGKVLKILYIITGNTIDWMVVMYCLSIILCSYIVLSIFYKYCSPCMSLFFAISFEVIIVAWVTFTTIAYISAFCGILLMCELIKANRLFLKKLKLTLLVIFLFVFSYLLRTDAFYSAILLSIPYILFNYSKNIMDNKKSVAIIIFSVFILLVTSSLLNYKVYNTEMWKEYHEWNESRSLVFDYPVDGYSNDVYKNINYSYNDYKGIETKRFIADKRVYSINNLNEISTKTKASTRKNRSVIQIINKLIKMKEYWWFLIVFVLCCFIIEKRTYLFIQLLVTQLLAMYLFYINRPLQRILVILFLISSLLMIAETIQRKKTNRLNSYSYALVIVFMILGLFSAKQIHKNMIDGNSADKEYSKVYEYMHNHSELLFVMNGEKNIWKYYSAGIISRSPRFNNVESLCSYNLYSDIYYKHVKEYKLKHKDRLLLDIVDNNNVLLVDWDNESAKYIQKYLEEHTNRQVKMKTIKNYHRIKTNIYSVNYLE